MIAAIAVKELVTYLRSGVFISLALAMLALFAAAAALSSQRLDAFERERLAAETVDREVWNGQGERNPHSAAHFARYAFKPIPRLVAFDPGVTDYAGIALWMEAHHQNPAVFRRAEDLGDAGRMADLSPAWVLQYAAPLFVFLVLFGAIAGEREAGTLRQMATTGVRPRAVLAGKLLGAGAVLGGVLVPALAASVWAAGAPVGDDAAGGVLPDIGVRTVGLALVYALFAAATGVFAIGVSALFQEKRNALIVLVAVWAASFVMAPRLASGFAAFLYPQPDANAVSEELAAAAGAARGDEAYQEEIRAAILADYGVDDIEALPVNYSGYALQKSEEYAHPLFESLYERIDAIYDAQEGVLRGAALVSPVIALQQVSAGLAGADRLHQDAFRASAERHRRKSVKLLNDDLMANGAGRPRYAADETLWRQVEDFSHTPPRFADIASRYGFYFLVLGGYALAAFRFAGWALNRAQKRIAA